MREYIESLRLLWKHFADGEPVSYEGRYLQFTSPPFNPWGLRPLARPQIPIYLACLKPRMLQMAGELADGVLGYLNTPRFVDEHVRPNVAKGAEKAGRDPADVEITSLVICSVSDDREEAMRLARINVGMYVAYPVSATVIEFMGLEEERDAVVHALIAGGPPALENATSDELVRTFAIAGTPDEAAEQLAEFEGRLPHIVLHTPYVPPITGAESERAFRNIVAAFARDRAA
jgi:alkanesulfonate monooxygenase SsuD/methylene tetrahydromethanopterin reductase-like flavin-dependent oxidoreductase (luciferase family)